MPQELTAQYNTSNYLEATKDFNFILGYEEFAGTICVSDLSQNKSLSSIRRNSHEKLSEGWNRLAK